jgi:hypothetical protein
LQAEYRIEIAKALQDPTNNIAVGRDGKLKPGRESLLLAYPNAMCDVISVICPNEGEKSFLDIVLSNMLNRDPAEIGPLFIPEQISL